MKRRLLACGALIVLALAWDLQRPPERQLTARGAVAVIHLYQSSLGRVYARLGAQCRFTPTCSHYGAACIRQFGAVRGGWMAMRRVVRCGPWTPAGTVDPPPISFPLSVSSSKLSAGSGNSSVIPRQTAIALHR